MNNQQYARIGQQDQQAAYPQLPVAQMVPGQAVQMQQLPIAQMVPQQQQQLHNLPVATPVYATNGTMLPPPPAHAHIVVQQPGAMTEQQARHLRLAHWEADMFDCSARTCCTSLFCPTCRWAQTMKRAGIMSFPKAFALVSLPMVLYMFCNWQLNKSVRSAWEAGQHDGNGTHHMRPEHMDQSASWDDDTQPDFDRLSSAFFWIMGMMAMAVLSLAVGVWGRSRVRSTYGIRGTFFSDLMLWCCCSTCALAQEATHVDRVQGFEGPDGRRLRV
jgi:Cys-rich protein (TIGR01571 family)